MINLDTELQQRLDALSAVIGRDMHDQIREAILRAAVEMWKTSPPLER
jgi:predicted DNA-binding protein